MLESHVGDNTRGEVESQTWLVGQIEEVPYVNTIGFGDEDDSWSGWRKCSAGIVGGVVGGATSENGLVVALKVDFPDGEVEVVDGEQKIGEEW